MNANFADGDYLVKLDFARNAVKDSAEMQKQMVNFIARLKRRFKKEGKELKYIYVKEIGSKGGRHVHLMLNKCNIDWIRETWPHGGIHIDPLYSDGQYAKIASYFIKYAAITEQTEGKLVGKRWYASRNLQKPKVKKMIISAGSFRKNIRIKKGYYLEKDSVVEGVCDLTGYEFFAYTLHKVKKRKGNRDAS